MIDNHHDWKSLRACSIRFYVTAMRASSLWVQYFMCGPIWAVVVSFQFVSPDPLYKYT